MATSNRSTLFRITGLPIDEAEDVHPKLHNTIARLLSKDELQQLSMDIAVAPSCDDDGQTSIALVDFRGGIPQFLSHLVKNSLGDWQIEMGDRDINFDRHFFGYTQLYAIKPAHPVTAE